MTRRTIFNQRKWTHLGLWLALLLMHQTATHAAPLASIENLTVSPRDVGTSTTLGFDTVATGLNTVGVGKIVYLAPKPEPGSEGLISGYTWNVKTQPTDGAVIDSMTDINIFKFHPTKPGRYVIELVPLDQNSSPTEAAEISLWAAVYMGAVNDSFSCASCHDGGMMPDKITPWSATAHATKLTRTLNGQVAGTYKTSCLPCHTVGAFADTRGDGNFLDVAATTSFDLNRIPTWVADALANGTQHWNDLPADLQNVGNIQCESCHGPGKTHNGDPTKIAVPSYDGKICSVCHDAPTHHMKPYQWQNSAHSNTLGEGGHMASGSCVKCHTAEGFVAIQVDGNTDIPAELTSRNNVSCLACHDSHDATNPHQLRKVSAVTLPNGEVYDAGLGNQCANCHNSRIADANVTVDVATGSSRGAHHGPQADILLGSSAYTWGQDYPAGASIHYSVVEDSCVHCHMAPVEASTANPPAVGDHTFRINSEDGLTSTVAESCG
ncbi:MAG: hypothetical protein M1457_00960, partial [bacterium]|nr:hypothetical protein [bacterium]